MVKFMIVIDDTNIRILDAQPSLNYFDMQQIELPKAIGPLEVWNRTMAHPQPLLKVAFQVRDAVSSLFGVKRIGGFSRRHAKTVGVGDKLDFFLVEYVDRDCLVLTERDRHLDVMTCISTEEQVVKVTSSVLVHNLFGHLYMIPVGIAHRWIVRRMLRRLKNQMTE
ncbi:MAG: DUF2867 domain-containing protein [Hyphomicrobiales bacterium]|nr:DUF2867 domain-containing protein [Hyphomicrobiales bacterium]